MPTWKEITSQNPEHSQNYARRWENMIAQGHDIDGEARLVDAIAPHRGARILDAGCGQGRLGGYLAQRGHEVVGTDIDEVLIGHAKEKYPEATWYVGDLSTDPIAEDNFEVAVSAGNVMGFLAPEGRESALQHIFDAVAPGGRFLVGFGAGRGWGFDDFMDTARKVGFSAENVFESWDLLPFNEGSQFLVAFFRKPAELTF
ncbi:class I SAM-dependent methyltransferase [Corynebacterium sp. S7]